jgi:hypothetical protein
VHGRLEAHQHVGLFGSCGRLEPHRATDLALPLLERLVHGREVLRGVLRPELVLDRLGDREVLDPVVQRKRTIGPATQDQCVGAVGQALPVRQPRQVVRLRESPDPPLEALVVVAVVQVGGWLARPGAGRAEQQDTRERA